MVRLTLQAIGAEGCVYVGDSEVDVATAANAGAPCVTVTWGFRDEDTLKAAGATHFCHQAADLPAMIENITKTM